MIVGFIGAPSTIAAGTRNGISHLPSVCRDWQILFEAFTFKEILVNTPRIASLHEVVQHRPERVALIRHILLRIELAEYDCDDCDKAEDEATISRNNRIFSTCIRQLFDVLSTWDPTPAAGLTLELSVICPSDNQHHLYQHDLDEDYPVRFASDLQRVPSLADVHRERASRRPYTLRKHRARLRQSVHPRIPMIRAGVLESRICATALQLRAPGRKLPSVPIVRGLLIRHNPPRAISVKTLAQILSQSLVALEWFRWERRISSSSSRDEATIKSTYRQEVEFSVTVRTRLTNHRGYQISLPIYYRLYPRPYIASTSAYGHHLQDF